MERILEKGEAQQQSEHGEHPPLARHSTPAHVATSAPTCSLAGCGALLLSQASTVLEARGAKKPRSDEPTMSKLLMGLMRLERFRTAETHLLLHRAQTFHLIQHQSSPLTPPTNLLFPSSLLPQLHLTNPILLVLPPSLSLPLLPLLPPSNHGRSRRRDCPPLHCRH